MKQVDTHAPSRVEFAGTPTVTWVKYSAVFILLWVLLTQGNTGSWVIGIAAVPLALWCFLNLFQPLAGQTDFHRQNLHLSALLRFIPFFVEQSLKGGWDSALFAIHPARRVNPDFITYITRLPAGRPQLFFINIVSLLPGTVSASRADNTMTIHVLDAQADNVRALQQCEIKIATLFGIRLEDKSPEAKAIRTGESQ